MRTILINNQRFTSCVAAASLLLSLLAGRPLFAAHSYRISLSDDLARMRVEARFDREAENIAARSAVARQYLRAATNCDNDSDLGVRARRLELPAGGIRCLRYTVDLRSAARADDLAPILVDSLAASPSVWLWRPRLEDGDEIFATFRLPDGAGVFVPWQRLDADGTRYRLVASPESGTATAIFGKFRESTERLGAARLRIVLLDTGDETEFAPLIEWVRATASSIASAYGRFPNPAATVVLMPVAGRGRDDGAVYFGRVVRDGGETIELMINQHRPVEEYYGEWIPTHEFSHLMLPYLNHDQRWISEGFAQYYQNLLMARAGRQSVHSAWQKLVDGLERGRRSAPALSPNDAARSDGRDTRMKVYWSGAALALMADVELRVRSGGHRSLDSLLGELQRCCLPSAYTWSGRELFAKLDELSGDRLFMDLYDRFADAGGFPDTGPQLARLGVFRVQGGIELNDDAELAEFREAMTRPAAAAHSYIIGVSDAGAPSHVFQ